MAVTTVKHDGRTVISSDEGGWNYSPGHKGNNLAVVTLARAKRSKLAERAVTPGSHRLTVYFYGTEAGMASFRTRLETLYNGQVGTLEVPGHPNVSKCAFVGKPNISPQKAGPGGNYGYDIELEILEL